APEPMALIFFAAGVALFVRFDRTGGRRAWAAAFVAMGLGMLSKEAILSLPLVLAADLLVFSPPRLVSPLPFFPLSGVYAVLRMTSSAVGAAPYPLTFGLPALRNLGRFACWTLFACQNTSFSRPLVVGTVALLFASYALIRNPRLALFSLAWYLAA